MFNRDIVIKNQYTFQSETDRPLSEIIRSLFYYHIYKEFPDKYKSVKSNRLVSHTINLLAQSIGISITNLRNKFTRNNFSVSELAIFADFCGFELTLHEKNNKANVIIPWAQIETDTNTLFDYDEYLKNTQSQFKKTKSEMLDDMSVEELEAVLKRKKETLNSIINKINEKDNEQ